MIICSIVGYAGEKVFLGILFFLASVFHFGEFQRNSSNVLARYIYLGLALFGVALGITILIVKTIDLPTVCLVFGIMDAASGLIEILTNSLILKMSIKTPTNCAEYLISTADIVFGIILIIKLQNGLLIHILYLATIFIVNGLIALIETIVKYKSHE